MNNVYGVLGLNGKTLGILAIVAVVTLVIAILLYIFGRPLPGVIVHLGSFALVTIGIVTWWTSIKDWNSGGAFGAVVGSGILLVIWLAIGGRMFYDSFEKNKSVFGR